MEGLVGVRPLQGFRPVLFPRMDSCPQLRFVLQLPFRLLLLCFPQRLFQPRYFFQTMHEFNPRQLFAFPLVVLEFFLALVKSSGEFFLELFHLCDEDLFVFESLFEDFCFVSLAFEFVVGEHVVVVLLESFVEAGALVVVGFFAGAFERVLGLEGVVAGLEGAAQLLVF